MGKYTEKYYLFIRLYKDDKLIVKKVVDTRFNHVITSDEYTILLDLLEIEED